MPLSPIRTVLRVPRGYRSTEAATFVAQLDDLTELLAKDLRGLTARELEWQPAPGRNSIGMLLAHLALVEAAWLGGPAIRETEVDFPKIVGLGRDDDGIPAGPGDRHPRALRGKPLAYYLQLLARSRRYVRTIAKRFTPAEIEEPLARDWRSQNRRHLYNRRWVLYHVIEHFAGHYGQILLLRELMRLPKDVKRSGQRASAARTAAPPKRARKRT